MRGERMPTMNNMENKELPEKQPEGKQKEKKQDPKKTALSYLHRDAIVLKDAPRGYVLIRYEGLPLGFVKNLGNRCNSLHPQSRRIRMDIR